MQRGVRWYDVRAKLNEPLAEDDGSTCVLYQEGKLYPVFGALDNTEVRGGGEWKPVKAMRVALHDRVMDLFIAKASIESFPRERIKHVELRNGQRDPLKAHSN